MSVSPWALKVLVISMTFAFTTGDSRAETPADKHWSSIQAQFLIKRHWEDCAPKKVTIKSNAYGQADFYVPTSGGTGVFFVRNGEVGETLKFGRVPEHGAVASRKILAMYKIAHDHLIKATTSKSEIDAAVKKIEQARDDGKFDNQDAALINQRLERLKRNAAGDDGTPKMFLRTSIVPLAGRGETFGAMLFSTSQDLGQDERDNDKMLAAKALADPKNQQFLGALYVADAILGNGDRMSKKGFGNRPNWNNIVVGKARRANDPPCLVAIDNDVVSPSIRQILFDELADGEPQDGTYDVTLTSDDFVKRLTETFTNKNLAEAGIGPAHAFGWSLSGMVAPNPSQEDHRCWTRSYNLEPFMISRKEVQRLVDDLVTGLEDTEDHSELTWSWDDVNCVGTLDKQPVVPGNKIDIDFSAFVENFEIGTQYALKAFLAPKRNKAYLRKFIQAKKGAAGLDLVSWDGVQARLDYLSILANATIPTRPSFVMSEMLHGHQFKKRGYRKDTEATFHNVQRDLELNVYVWK